MNQNIRKCPDVISSEEVLDRIQCRLINTAKNKERLSRLVHREYMDLSVIYYIQGDISGEEVATAILTHNTISKLDLTHEEIEAAAMRNTLNSKFEMFSLADCALKGNNAKALTLHEISKLKGDEAIIVQKSNGLFGAAALLHPDIFRDIAHAKKSDLYILPSSQHEIIVIQARGYLDIKGIQEMVADINVNIVGDDDYLSDSIYHYSRELNMISRFLPMM